MLEDLALGFVNLGELATRAINIGVALAGFAAGLAWGWKRPETLTRAPYFALCAALFPVLKLLDCGWLLSIPALSAGVLSLLVAANLAGIAALGGLYGGLATARARDAFATPRYALLAAIPVVNLMLFLAPSRQPPRAGRLPAALERAAPLLTGGNGVATGVVLLLTGIVIAEAILAPAQQRAASDPATQRDQIAALLGARGLEGTLQIMAAGVRLPVRVDAVTTFAAIAANGNRLSRTYVVDLPAFALSEAHKASIEQALCTSPPLSRLLADGATIEERYVAPGGALWGSHVVTQAQCRR